MSPHKPPQQSAKERTDSDDSKNGSVRIPDTPTEKNTAAAKQPRSNCNWRKFLPEKWTDWLMVTFNGLLALFTFFLWQATNGLWADAHGQLKVMKDQLVEMKSAGSQTDKLITTNQTSERAWISFSGANTIRNLKAHLEDGSIKNGYAISISLANSGKTPAVNTEVASIIRTIHTGDKVPEFIPDNNILQRNATIGPNVVFSGMQRFISDEDVESLRNNKIRIFIYNKITYNDIFNNGIPRITEICMEVFYAGVRGDNKETSFRFIPNGPQNYAN